MAFPTVAAQAIADRWRPLSTAEGTVATARIADAKAELNLQLRLRGVVDTIGDAEWERLYVATVVEMVRRYLVNPDGWLEESEGSDDYTATKRRDKSMSGGLVYVTDAEVDRLVPRVRPRRGAFSIRPSCT